MRAEKRTYSIQKRLLTKNKLTLKRALELATATEAADMSTKTFKVTEASSISKLVTSTTVVKPQSLPACYRCDKRNHVSKNCHFKNECCHRCGKIGHIASVCCYTKGKHIKIFQKNLKRYRVEQV